VVSGKRRRFLSEIQAGSIPDKRLPSPRTSMARTFSRSPRLVATKLGLGVICMSFTKLIAPAVRSCHQEWASKTLKFVAFTIFKLNRPNNRHAFCAEYRNASQRRNQMNSGIFSLPFYLCSLKSADRAHSDNCYRLCRMLLDSKFKI